MKIGDKVRIKPYKLRCAFVGFLGANGDSHPSPHSGKEGWITSESQTTSMMEAFLTISDYVSDPYDTVNVRYLGEDSERATVVRLPKSLVELVSEGDGRLIIGETCPASPHELRQDRLSDFRRRLVDAERARGEGWTNAATFLTHTYLVQSREAGVAVARIRRKDGGVHPDKLHDLFESLVSRGVVPPVDDWALAPALDVPTEFEHLTASLTPNIRWKEICDYLQKTYNEEICR